MKKSVSKTAKVYIISLGAVLLASVYPIYMGAVMLTAYLKEGGIRAADYPKYIIPYTPVCIALICSVALLPLAFKLCKRLTLPALSILAVVLFLSTETGFEKITVFSGAVETPEIQNIITEQSTRDEEPEEITAWPLDGSEAVFGKGTVYVLENATDRDKLEKMMYVSLFEDGKARLSSPPISSLYLPDCKYSEKDGTIFILFDNSKGVEFFDMEDGQIIATFEVVDDNTIIFKGASVALFASPGARYVSGGQPPVVYTPAENEITVENWQMYMCYAASPYFEENEQEVVGNQEEKPLTEQPREINGTRTLAKNPLIADYSPMFKMHFYMISIIITLSVLGVAYGFYKMAKDENYKKKKPLSVQLVSVTVFVGLCVFACFTAFFRKGEIVVSPLSAVLMTVFFLSFGVSAGVYAGTWLYGKRPLFSAVLPSVTAIIVTVAMYVGEMVMMKWNLYRLGEGFFFNPLGACPLAVVDLLIIALSGAITYLILVLIRNTNPDYKKQIEDGPK